MNRYKKYLITSSLFAIGLNIWLLSDVVGFSKREWCWVIIFMFHQLFWSYFGMSVAEDKEFEEKLRNKKEPWR